MKKKKKDYTPCPWYVQDASPDLRTKYPPRWKGLRYEVVRGLGIGDNDFLRDRAGGIRLFKTVKQAERAIELACKRGQRR